MKTKFDIKSSLLGAILGAAVVLAVGAASRETGSPSEFKIVPGKVFQGELETRINSAAAEGWEFVSVSDMSTEQFAFAVMKRPRR